LEIPLAMLGGWAVLGKGLIYHLMV